MTKIYAAIGPNVFVKEIKVEQKVGGLVIPDSINTDYTYGQVVSCGEGYFDKGCFVAQTIFVGDKIAFPKISGTKVSFNGQKLIRVHAGDIVAKEVDSAFVPSIPEETE